MKVFKSIEAMGHEQVVYCQDQKTGLKAIIAIHSTTLGPALGGCRFWNYETEDDALFDVLRLSRGMTYKAAITGLTLGGGKSVIIGDPKKLKSEAFFRAFGRFVNGLRGRYITAEDVNINVEDMNIVAKETKYVSGLTSREGGSGDPSPVTALGVFHGIRAAVKHRLGKEDLTGLTVAVQGVGHVGHFLCKYLHQAGAKLLVSDINQESLEAARSEFGAQVVGVDEIMTQEADVFAPCALGAILDDNSIPKLNVPVVAGGANNQLLDEDKHAVMLKERGILHAPDYVINAGGLINVFHELKGYDEKAAHESTENIYHTLIETFETAEEENITTQDASDRVAEKRLAHAEKNTERLVNNFDNQEWITV